MWIGSGGYDGTKYVRKDLVQFAFPAIVLFTAELILSARFLIMLADLVTQPQSFFSLPLPAYAGLILLVVGFAIALTAQIILNRSYASTLIIREDHQLVTHGIYGTIRHPMYLGVLIVCAGIAIGASSVWAILSMSALIPVFLRRITIEERMLVEAFGDAYRQYAHSTHKLIPFIY